MRLSNHYNIQFKRQFMSAKTKLNIINANMALVTGAVLGALSGSWMVFFLTAAALIVVQINSGDIRFGGGGTSLRR